jgi:CHAT domain-containing protein
MRVMTCRTRRCCRLLFVVAMPSTPGAADLPGALAEAAALRARYGPGVLVLNGAGGVGVGLGRGAGTATAGTVSAGTATAGSVSAAMLTYPWAHFACHASSRIDNPSASCLLLADYQTRPLTALDIGRLDLDRAELAFLSACSTARTGGVLPDEAITLASAFQLAGYRQVVATLWPVDDWRAVRLTEIFYAGLAPGEAAGAATALHHAVRWLRAAHAGQPSAWSAPVHSGG